RIETIRDAVAAVLPAIEVVDSRFTNWTAVGGLQLIADQAGAGHWVYGEESHNLEDIDLADHPVTLSVNGEVRQRGSSANVLGNPLKSLTWLANDLARNGVTLRAGEVVTTGSCTPAFPAAKGDVAV